MLNAEFNLEEYGDVRWEYGKREGRLEGKLETAMAMLAEGIPPEIVAKCTKYPLERILQLQTQT